MTRDEAAARAAARGDDYRARRSTYVPGGWVVENCRLRAEGQRQRRGDSREYVNGRKYCVLVPMAGDERYCAHCHTVKDRGEFRIFQTGGRKRVQSWCRPCEREYQRPRRSHKKAA